MGFLLLLAACSALSDSSVTKRVSTCWSLGNAYLSAVECILTGRNIPAAEALALRMVNEVVPDDKVEARALELAKEIAANSPDSVIAGLYGEF